MIKLNSKVKFKGCFGNDCTNCGGTTCSPLDKNGYVHGAVLREDITTYAVRVGGTTLSVLKMRLEPDFSRIDLQKERMLCSE